MINLTKQKVVFIETYGCQMNEYETEPLLLVSEREDDVITHALTHFSFFYIINQGFKILTTFLASFALRLE